MPRKYVVRLDAVQRDRLDRLVHSGRHAARELIRARVLLKADEASEDQEIAEAVETSVRTVERVRKQFCLEGLDAALHAKPQPPRPDKRKIDGVAEAKLIALACSEAPTGHDHWTLQLLADRMVRLRYVDHAVSYQTVRRVLKKTRPSRG
jgi:transposase